VIVSIFRGQPRSLPFTVEMMERHPLASPGLRARCRASPIWSSSRPPAPRRGVDELRVFLARGDQGVNYATGVWHHPLLALDAVCDFLVVDRSGTAPNCDEVTIDPPGLIVA
jgi:ureidoglycolate lyase